SVVLPAQQVLSELMARGIKDVVISVVASPESTVIGGAPQTVRELVAEWEQRDVMAREVAIDIASHTPQVEPILGDLSEALGELAPGTPEIPFYSTSLFDPREQPVCNARYWVDNLRRTVRFAAAVQAAMEDGYRVFAELAPHPLLTHPLEQNARSLDVPLAALASMRREQELPHGLRAFLADLHSAGATVDFSVLYPHGRLVDAPLPTWTHRQLLLSREGGQESPTHGACTVSVHPLLGSHVRLQEEPERHVWQGEVGTAAQPWLGDHQVRNMVVFPGAAYCEMALAAAHAVLGEASEVRDIHFEQALLLDKQTTVGASASLSTPGVLDFTVETTQEGEQARQASAVLHAAEEEQPPAHDTSALLAAHPRREDGDELRKRLDQRGLQYGPAFAGLDAVHTGDGATVLAEVALPRQIRSHQGAYRVHPALLDACTQSVAAHPDVQALGEAVFGLPLGMRRIRSYTAVRDARYCYTRVTKADPSGVEADIDVLDEHGAVLLALQGLRLSASASETANKDRI
ncbi:MAG: acyltransferase domain-containing protein, partial [Mycobacterium sp.]